MHRFHAALLVALTCAPVLATDAQSTAPAAPAQTAQSLVVSTVRVGGVATVRTADGWFRIDADRIDISPANSELGRADTIVVESANAGEDVMLRVTEPGSVQAVTIVAARFTLTRVAGSGELQVRGENRREP